MRATIDSATSAGVRAPMSSPAGVSSRLEQLLGDALGAQLLDHRRAALPARHEAHVADARLEPRAQRRHLVVAVGRHDEREVPALGVSTPSLMSWAATISRPTSGAERAQRRDDRRVAGHEHARRRQHRLEEDLDRAAGQAVVA